MRFTPFASVAAIALFVGVGAPMTRDPHPPLPAYPNTLGNSTSAPYAARYAANRAQLAALARPGAWVTAGGRAADRPGASRRGGTRVSPALAAAFRAWVAQRRQVLAFDPRGDGRMVEVLGDLAHARNVVVYVPGNAKRLDNFDAGTTAAPKTAPGPVARALAARARAVRPSGHTAIIAWLGYDPPENIDLVAARSARARAGARALTRLIRVLPRGARVSLVCHSYGTVVCGRTAARVRVANVVALASPGMDVRSAASVRARVWAGRAADDPIRFTPHVRLAGLGHGPDPMSAPFGAHVIDTTATHGHENYFTPGTRSLEAIGRIVAGTPPTR